MTKAYTQHAQVRITPQSEPIPGREAEMVKNSAGGFTFALDVWGALDRFLVLGSESPTYYASQRDLTKANIARVRQAIAEDGVRVVNRVFEIDRQNRAPKLDPLLFTLALAHSLGDAATKQKIVSDAYALIRTGTHLFQYLSALVALGSKLGRSKRAAIEKVLQTWGPDKLAYQVTKYRNREGWTWRDLLRVAHPKPADPVSALVLRWPARGPEPVVEGIVPDPIHPQISDFVEAQYCDESRLVELVASGKITHEMIPSERISPTVLEALAAGMPSHALLRNLGRIASKGLLKPGAALTQLVAERLEDAEAMRKSRVHPIAVLSAKMVYDQGHGARGGLTWTRTTRISEALEAAFYNAFGTVTPSGKNVLLALDVSGSMGAGEIAGVPGLTPAMGTACMALVTARTEPSYEVRGFTDTLSDLFVTAKDSLDSAQVKVRRSNFGRTDCALPMLWAAKEGLRFEAFVVYTDNETWCGHIHPTQALRAYRQQTGIPAKLIVVGMTATNFSIADPADLGMLDVVGFDTAAPTLIADFAAGR